MAWLQLHSFHISFDNSFTFFGKENIDKIGLSDCVTKRTNGTQRKYLKTVKERHWLKLFCNFV